MKRSDWLLNKEREIPPRPSRLFNLTDELVETILKNHKNDVFAWPENRTLLLNIFLEGLPEYINNDLTPGNISSQIKASPDVDPNMKLWAFKTDRWACMVSLVIKTGPNQNLNHAFVISKNTLGLFELDSSMSYPLFDNPSNNNPFTTPVGPGVQWGWENTANPNADFGTVADPFRIYGIGGGGSGGTAGSDTYGGIQVTGLSGSSGGLAGSDTLSYSTTISTSSLAEGVSSYAGDSGTRAQAASLISRAMGRAMSDPGWPAERTSFFSRLTNETI